MEQAPPCGCGENQPRKGWNRLQFLRRSAVAMAGAVIAGVARPVAGKAEAFGRCDQVNCFPLQAFDWGGYWYMLVECVSALDGSYCYEYIEGIAMC